MVFPKVCFYYIQPIKAKNMSKLCYEKFTKFENVFKIGPEPMFYIFYGMNIYEKHMLDTILIEFRAKIRVL